MKLKIGYRTLKTALGAGISIFIAQALNLEFYASAAILTILCISVSRKGSLRAAWQRFAACMIGLAYSFILLELVGYQPWTLALILILFIPMVVRLNVKEGITTSTVIMLHVYTLGTVSWAIFINEFLLIVIGIGVALIMNAYMPNIERELRKHQRKIEANFRTILRELACYVRTGESEWDGREIPETADEIQKAKSIAMRNINNHFLRYEDQYYHYFKMRERQFDILERIMPFLSSLDDTVVQSDKIADLLEELSEAVSPVNTVSYFQGRIQDIRSYFEARELPKTQKEFETRSALYYVIHELEEYLRMKESLYEKQNKKEKSRER
ncbi:aromatic acid exporter family protein [Halalkalibacterium halodurans]|uniref:aromatic acid exporter family protein n=1 Tax=Halalkalibacterium halodurans TaxID=86665 RepID=UPI002AA9E0A0|nr:aromatic acid exporter family protein [Halalkalibacterium halodurans]MDY7221985.1 aromatic acid exporter family protein [Halalkalibacterium halodurans]MDY7241261.1 aromatic acid exporter family protein [Halalkalibacterium halodurans]